MEPFLGTLVWLAGTVQFTLAFQQLRRANPDDKLPQFIGRPRNHPGEIYAYRAIAMFLLMISFFAWMDLLGIWAVLLIFVGSLPAVILNVRHNRRVKARAISAARRESA